MNWSSGERAAQTVRDTAGAVDRWLDGRIFLTRSRPQQLSAFIAFAFFGKEPPHFKH